MLTLGSKAPLLPPAWASRKEMQMRNMVIGIAMIFTCTGCVNGTSLPKVDFEWFNLSTNEVWVTDVIGLPPEVSPGRLIRNRSEEDRLERSESTFSETVRIKDQITIRWKDNGKLGWPGGVNPPGSIPPGVAHVAEFKRADLGIPAKLRTGKIRFTYLGNDKWRVKFFPNESKD